MGEDSLVADKSLFEIYNEVKIRVLICAVQRGNEVYIPNGNFVIRSGDKIHMTALHRDLEGFIRTAGIMNKKIKSVMLIGGGKISMYLAEILIESGMNVKIIEQDQERCRLLAEQLPKADIVYGDGTEKSILAEEGIERVDALVALTGIDEENMVISMFANLCSVDKIVTKINRESFADIMDGTGTYSIVTPKNIIADTIIRYARAMKSAQDTDMLTLYRIVNNKAEVMEFAVNKESGLTALPLAQVKLKNNVLIAAIMRKNKMIVPDGSSKIEVGDTVIVVSTERIATLTDILD